MTVKPMRAVRVVDVGVVSPRVKQFTLADERDEALPAFSSGSHICVVMGDGRRVWRNAYSLVGEPGDASSYRIAVRKGDAERSRGGSIYLHEAVGIGDLLQITPPANYFPLASLQRKHVLIAGGIGITPILSHLACLRQAGAAYEIHYAFRDHAFVDILSREHGTRIHLYSSSAGSRLDPMRALGGQPLGTHVYVCGPHGLITDTRAAASKLGWPASHVRFEEFAPLQSDDRRPFTAADRHHGVTVSVEAERSLLSALEDAGVPIASSCRAGRCGTCRIRVAEGAADHRDRFLSEEERAAGLMLACVSRARGEHLTVEPVTL